MEAYILFARSKEEVMIRFEEEEEDIGCPSDSSAARSTSSSSDGVDLADDASSSGSNSHFEMTSLMSHLPIKRGLSMFFDGKSQSFASLAAVGGVEDLPKPPPAKRLKASWSCGVGLQDAHRGPHPSATGKKQASRARLTPPALGSAPRRMVRARPLVTARPAAAGKPLLFA